MNDAQALTNGVGLVLEDEVSAKNRLKSFRLVSLRGALGVATLFVLSVSGYAAVFIALHHLLHGQV